MAKVADGIRYAERVVAGEIVAGEFVRLACQRFLDDLKYGEKRGIYFSEPRAQHILNFYKFVPHVKGALAGQPIELMDWHVFILINIFGFVIPLVNEETGEVVMRSDGSGRPVMVRRFRTAYNEVARKNAKSTLSSGIGLYMTGADIPDCPGSSRHCRIILYCRSHPCSMGGSHWGRWYDRHPVFSRCQYGARWCGADAGTESQNSPYTDNG